MNKKIVYRFPLASDAVIIVNALSIDDALDYLGHLTNEDTVRSLLFCCRLYLDSIVEKEKEQDTKENM